jgi:hypothetical protein
VTEIIREFDPEAFYSVDDVQSAARGVFPVTRRAARGLIPSLFGSLRQVA